MILAEVANIDHRRGFGSAQRRFFLSPPAPFNIDFADIFPHRIGPIPTLERIDLIDQLPLARRIKRLSRRSDCWPFTRVFGTPVP